MMSKMTSSILAVPQTRQRQKLILTKSLMALAVCLMVSVISVGARAQSLPENWTFHSETSGIKVYYSIAECVGEPSPENMTDPTVVPVPNSVLLLKIENTNSKSASVSWNKELIANADVKKETAVVDATSTVKVDCSKAPSIVLSEKEDDGKPVSVAEAVKLLGINVSL